LHVKLCEPFSQNKLRLLEEDNSSLEKLEITDNHPVLIEGWWLCDEMINNNHPVSQQYYLYFFKCICK